jgi:hypothetical protein
VRRDATDHIRRQRLSLRRLPDVSHLVLPARRRVEVEKANRGAARV